MKIPLTKYGLPEVAIYPAIIVVAMAVAYLFRGLISPDWAIYVVEAVLLLVLLWCLSFFRDPTRKIPEGDNILISPADGTVSDIGMVRQVEGFQGEVLRIGIFLSVFNVHINRVPCDVKIDKIKYVPGKFKNAMDLNSSKVNEANNIYMTRTAEPVDKLLVRQISGAIARRIVCKVSPSQQLSAGTQFGMIKFGSRTELYIGSGEKVKCLVKKGTKVKAGLTILARYENG